MFGQTVLAELPSSMRAQSPNETRSVEAAFVHSGLDTGPVVQGAVRIDGELVLKPEALCCKECQANHTNSVESSHW